MLMDRNMNMHMDININIQIHIIAATTCSSYGEACVVAPVNTLQSRQEWKYACLFFSNGLVLCTGSRPASSHISLDPNSRLADAFAIYGVPRGITQYMSRKWSQPNTRGSVVTVGLPMRQSSSMITQQQLQGKVAAIKKASHVILLEAMQLR